MECCRLIETHEFYDLFDLWLNHFIHMRNKEYPMNSERLEAHMFSPHLENFKFEVYVYIL